MLAKIKKNYFLLITIFLFLYFIFNLLDGERGLFSYFEKKRLLVKDTKIENPYNTYIYKGLPPGPINNPGIDALIAAGDPLQTDYLFFVADNKGRHIFNKTFQGHLRSKK